MKSKITCVGFYVPEGILNNDELAKIFPEWTAEKILSKTGIRSRHIASEDECASDLAEKAALALFYDNQIEPESIDFLILGTQSPDYLLPTTACILQNRLGMTTKCGAFDFNLGCSAYIYGLAMAKGLISANVAKKILLITAETYSKHINTLDKSTRTIFGDGAGATLIEVSESDGIGEFILGTDGRGWDKLIVPAGGMRHRNLALNSEEIVRDVGFARTMNDLYMDGPEIFIFTISTVPRLVEETLEKNGFSLDEIDLFVFHQANLFMLEQLRKAIKIPIEKFFVGLEEYGNTVSATIPIALANLSRNGKLKTGMKVMLVGFGVGLSWGATVIVW